MSNGPPSVRSWCGNNIPLSSVVGGVGWQLVHDPVIAVEWQVAHPSFVWPWTNGIDVCASIVSAVGVFFS